VLGLIRPRAATCAFCGERLAMPAVLWEHRLQVARTRCRTVLEMSRMGWTRTARGWTRP